MTQREVDLVEAESSLKWAAEGEFSARITPRQAQALRAELERLRGLASYVTIEQILREAGHDSSLTRIFSGHVTIEPTNWTDEDRKNASTYGLCFECGAPRRRIWLIDGREVESLPEKPEPGHEYRMGLHCNCAEPSA